MEKSHNRTQDSNGQSQMTPAEKKCFVKIVAIGDSGVGKTSLIQMFEHTKFTESFKPTIGADFSNKEITIDGRIVTLQIWDTAGQERYQSLGTAFYRGADCCLLVYDITNPTSFENLITWKMSFLQKSMVLMPDTFPFIVVGNKLDIADEQRNVGYEKLQRFCKENGDMVCIETSAKSNKNVEQAFKLLAEQALKRQDEINTKVEEHFSTQKQARTTAKKLKRPQKGEKAQTQSNNNCNC